MKRIAVFILTLSFFSISYSDKNPVFQEYYEGNYHAAETGLKQLAEKNNGEATFYLATMYMNGFGVRRDFEKGFDYMTRAAELKYLPAQLYLGNYYFQQQKDLEKAVPWFKKAADAGDAGAQLFTGISYLNGYGVKKNIDIARKYFIRAAQNEIPMGQYELAKIFLASRHAGDRRMGRIWLTKAADKYNYPDAQYLLGTMLYTGNEAEKDPVKGVEWLEKAAANGSKEASKTLDKINRINTSDAKANSENRSEPTPWQIMVGLMQKAGVQLNNPITVTASINNFTKTPKSMALDKNSIIKLNLNLVNYKDIPPEKILSYMTQLNYKEEKFDLTVPAYPFEMPPGANNYKEAFQSLSRVANYGYAQSLFRLGQMYENGLGVQKDPETAFQLYMKAAEQNYLKAQYAIGTYYLQGKGVPQDYEKAISWFIRAALKGSLQAQFVLGNIYERGIKASNNKILFKNFDRAKAMYSLAVGGNLPIAAYRLAELYVSGFLNPDNNVSLETQNWKKAYALYQKAAKSGLEKADVALGYFYLQQNQTTLAEKTFEIAQKAYQTNDPEAAMLLAILYDRGFGVNRNSRKSAEILEKLSKQNNAIAQFMLGNYYLKNKRKENIAISLLEKSANQGNGYAKYNLAILAKQNKYTKPGENFLSLLIRAANHYDKIKEILADYYLLDTPVPGSEKKAVAIYQELANKQDPAAELKLGFMNEHGLLFPKDYHKAEEWYQKSAEQGNPIAQYLLGNMYYLGRGVDRDVNKAIDWLKKSAAQNYVPAKVGLGFIYEMSKHNYPEAKKWYTLASKFHNPQALYNLGLMYEYGKGVKSDPQKAFRLYKDAAQNGLDLAAVQVAGMYLKGTGIGFDPNTALKMYSQAAQKNNSFATYQLGLMSESGVAQKIDLNKARLYYEKAAKEGSVEAQLALARFYEFGISVPADISKSINFYQAAAAEGNEFAKQQLTRLSNQGKSSSNAMPFQCVNQVALEKVKNSFWKKVTDWIAPVPNIDYMNAIDYLNSGKVEQATTALQKIIKVRPNFQPARETVSHYFCQKADRK
ncbi:hypothetical protein AYM02_08905 [Coxiella burnetii]|uniref:tetratricopeptide repeat protein n=1 Tax=Coxiella burnetii TaxID=777 RepID=UPI0005937A6B|nr:SEL1-like repeat protein [Coxiella burnetii]AML49408.1 hypothetical protein AUR58_09720 [Coxiella burnetii]AML55329.1 hypothetical protein AYM38_08795 [Coxiella burnetii]ATN69308.1 hypothetical protein AYM00_09265 [Coxiella burnetii]ATN71224.1 hypothetical protein AYM02_08905 [Coxiella burnetii]ATN73130.1 hypothetical protein AYM11_08645 [Coxiella burnetii]